MLNKEIPQFASMKKEDLIALVLKQQNQITELQAKVELLEEMQRLARAEKYKPKCEQIETLFDETEIINSFSEPEEETTIVKEHPRRKRKPRVCLQAPSNTPVYTIDHTANAADSIEKDGIHYTRIEDRIIDKIASVPAKYVVERNIYPQYKADCEGVTNIVLFDNHEVESLACSASFASSIAVSKYDDHLPLYRQSEILERSGIILGRQTMAKWLITWYSQLTKVEEYFKKEMYKMKFLNMDETPLMVLDFKTESGKISKTSFMFIRQGSTYNEQDRKTRKLISCSYIQTRSAQCLTDDYLKYKCSSYVMTDGLKSYNNLPKHCSCWTHAVRRFKAIVKDRKEENAQKVILLVAELYKIEDKYREQLLNGSIDSSEFLANRKKDSIQVINEIFDFIDGLSGKYAEGAMDKAIQYIKERKTILPNYLNSIEATPDNNASERVAKAFATGRKNWEFSQTVNGADASCFMYSVIESAKVNGINPLDYLEFLFTFGPVATTEEQMKALLPWNADLSRLNDIKTSRMNAVIDNHRTTPYTFTGLGRC